MGKHKKQEKRPKSDSESDSDSDSGPDDVSGDAKVLDLRADREVMYWLRISLAWG